MAGLAKSSPNESMILSTRNNKKILTWKFSPHWNWSVSISRVTISFFFFWVFEFFKLKQHFKRYQISDIHKEVITMPENSTSLLSKTLSPPWWHWPTVTAAAIQVPPHTVCITWWTGANTVLHLLINSKKKRCERIHNCMPTAHVLSSPYTFHVMFRSFIQHSKIFLRDVWLTPFPALTHQGQQCHAPITWCIYPKPHFIFNSPCDQKKKLNKNSSCWFLMGLPKPPCLCSKEGYRAVEHGSHIRELARAGHNPFQPAQALLETNLQAQTLLRKILVATSPRGDVKIERRFSQRELLPQHLRGCYCPV